jgi:cell division protein FtsX
VVTHRDSLALALRSLIRRPLASVLTVIAITLGHGLLVALAAIAGTADGRILKEVGDGGPVSAIRVAAAEPGPRDTDGDELRTGRPHDLDESAVIAIRRAPDVVSVDGLLESSVLVVPVTPVEGGHHARRVPLPDPFEDMVIGADLRRPRDLPVSVLAGRLPRAHSLTEVAVSLDYLRRVGIDPRRAATALGTEIEFAARQGDSDAQWRDRWCKARVVGVVAHQLGVGDFVVPLDQTRLLRHWQLGGAGANGGGLSGSPYTGLIVVAAHLDDVHTVRTSIHTLGYASSAPEQLARSVLNYLHVAHVVLAAIGTTAVVIAVLGIANALFIAVRERRREIAALKAIGARDRDVARWFLFEALILGVAGGAAGSALGLGVSAVMSEVVNGCLVSEGLEGIGLGTIPWKILLVGMAATCVVSALAAALPALAAARLPARDAMGAL